MLKFVIAVMLAGSIAGVQAEGQTQSKIKKVRQYVEFSEDVKVGSTVLKSGSYLVTSNDNQELTFRRALPDPAYTSQMVLDNRTKPVVVKTTATVLDSKSKGTHVDMPKDSAGVATLKSITLDDTNVKFTIDQ